MSELSRQIEFLQSLQAVHEFPGPFTFKAIGENNDEFVSQVVQAVLNVLGQVEPEVTTRESSGAKHISVTVDVEVDSPEKVLAVYRAFEGVEGVRFVL